MQNHCRLIHSISLTFNKEFDQQIVYLRATLVLLNLSESKIKIYVGVDGDICVNLKKLNSLLELCCFPGSIVRRHCSSSVASFEDQVC